MCVSICLSVLVRVTRAASVLTLSERINAKRPQTDFILRTEHVNGKKRSCTYVHAWLMVQPMYCIVSCSSVENIMDKNRKKTSKMRVTGNKLELD